MVVLDIALMALICAAIVGLLVWSIYTQHRDYGCAELRIRRRLQISVRLVPLDKPKLQGGSSIVSKIYAADR